MSTTQRMGSKRSRRLIFLARSPACPSAPTLNHSSLASGIAHTVACFSTTEAGTIPISTLCCELNKTCITSMFVSKTQFYNDFRIWLLDLSDMSRVISFTEMGWLLQM